MIYLRARYYNPAIGRFTSLDIEEGKISSLLDMNRYVYCRNNPVKYVDPSGESVIAYGINASAGIGAIGLEGMYLWATDSKGNFALLSVNGYSTSIGLSLGGIGMVFPDMPDISNMYGYGFGLSGSLNSYGAGISFGGEKGEYQGFVIQGGIGADVDVSIGGDGSYSTPIFTGNIYTVGGWMKNLLNQILPEKLRI